MIQELFKMLSKMHRYFILLAYKGSNYVGWQIQPNGLSIQEAIQNALSTILRETVDVVGAGRTDAGVHAESMFAHFDLSKPIEDRVELVRRLNNFLPKDIAVKMIYPVKENAHARFTAIARTYNYYLTTKKTPFQYELKRRVYFEPDIDKMNQLCSVLMEYSDFTSFSKLHSDAKTNICHVSEAYWEKKGDEIIFTITADRFLRNMVRSIVGTLLEAGRGRLDEKGFRQIIEKQDRRVAGDSAPAHGLFLKDVKYPDDIWI